VYILGVKRRRDIVRFSEGDAQEKRHFGRLGKP
jgi:hypothetical protein